MRQRATHERSCSRARPLDFRVNFVVNVLFVASNLPQVMEDLGLSAVLDAAEAKPRVVSCL